MENIHIEKINESFMKIHCDRSTSKELSEYFAFYVPNYQFSPIFKSKVWNGKIYLYNLKENTIYVGLLPYVIEFMVNRNYAYDVDDSLEITHNFSVAEAKAFIEKLKIPKSIENREYQVNAFVRAIREKRKLILSPTASGKSFIIYLILAYLQAVLKKKKGLIIVPTTSLVEQLYSDFKSYGYPSEKYCHRQYSNYGKNTDKFLIISTWQTLQHFPSDYFEQFDFVFGDEAHGSKANEIKRIMESSVNADYRIGTTGTFDGKKTHRLIIEGLFGSIFRTTTTHQLMKEGKVAELFIKILVLKHPEWIRSLFWKENWKYAQEIEYITTNEPRNQFIKNLALSLSGNTLILYQSKDHGRRLYRLISDEANGKLVYLINGDTPTLERERIRHIAESNKNVIIVASYQTYSTGVNIKNLDNGIFASPSKSRIRVLQSIGRILRKSHDDSEATLFDISDDFRLERNVNNSLTQISHRIKMYIAEKFNYKIYKIGLNYDSENYKTKNR